MLRTMLLLVFSVLLAHDAAIPAQCSPPASENFDSATVASILGCGNTNLGVLPSGWINAPGYQNSWRVWTGGTYTNNTGPSGDHTSGSGNYMVLEATGCSSGATGILHPPCFDATGLSNPAAEFWYHMLGSTMGSLELQQFAGGTWSTIWMKSGDQGPQWAFATVPVTPVAGLVQLRFRGTIGSGFYSDMALDDFSFGEGSPLLWQPNRPEAHMDIDGVQADPYNAKALISKTLYTNCTPPHSVSATVTLSSSVPGQAFEVVASSVPTVPATGPSAVVLPDAQVVNLDLFPPTGGAGTFLFVNGMLLPRFDPLPSPLVVTTTHTTPGTVSIQGMVTNPSAPLGTYLTQASQLDVVGDPNPPPFPGPTNDDSHVTLDLNAPPVCWTTSSVPFYGTSFTTLHIISNGRVLLGGQPDVDYSATVGEALGDEPFVGFWTDLNPAGGGTITVTEPSPGVLRVDYQNVPYLGETATVTFGIRFDTSAGMVTLDGLAGISPNPLTGTGSLAGDSQFFGMSPGTLLGATDPGVTSFAPGVSGSPTASTDMLYDFANQGGPAGLVNSLTGALGTLVFTPTTSAGLVPNYDWAGF